MQCAPERERIADADPAGSTDPVELGGGRTSQPLLDECAGRGIAFVPFSPLGPGASGSGSVLEAPAVVAVATRLGRTPAQVALAWALTVSPNVF